MALKVKASPIPSDTILPTIVWSPSSETPLISKTPSLPSALGKGGVFLEASINFFSYQQPQYRFKRYLHLRNCTHANSHILHACTKQIDIIVNDQEPIVVPLLQLHKLDFTILLIMLL